ncbi:RidA family protein [Pseudoflavitalea sp. X16]|uniref:RidA family protein n=1 Tax=Paraflavitalea devenefica TaxID=2716334 RepID=UPI001422C158|nr:RidA family protein [Paraflavitalea devenefica]NII28784.1 RidA family protein [Paraflavitalea devenefica]
MDIIAKLTALGLSLPAEPPKPGGLYEPVRVIGNMAYVAVQFPLHNGKLAYRGRLGAELTTEEGVLAARYCALNVLAQIHKHVGFDNIVGLNFIEAKMLTTEGWNDFARVLDGASGLFLDTLGEAGRHARSLSGAHSLPMNAPITLTTTFTVR